MRGRAGVRANEHDRTLTHGFFGTVARMKPRTPGLLLAVGALDLALALAIATLIRLQFLVSSVNPSAPPQCFNHYGGSVNCGLEDWTAPIFLVLIAATFVVLAAIEYIVWRRRGIATSPGT